MSGDSTRSSKSPEEGAKTGKLPLTDGHTITYTSIGNDKNPLLLFVVGSSGLGSLYHRLATEFSATFRCVYYDKRGFLPKDYSHEIARTRKNPLILAEQHADDAAELIKHLTSNQPAYVFGTSTGGTAVLDLTIRYPDLVHTGILHEPITFSVMRDVKLRDEMIALYRRVGDMEDPVEAFSMFSAYMFRMPQRASSEKLLDEPAPSPTSESRSISSPSPVQIYNGRQGNQEAIAMVKYVVDERRARQIRDKVLLICGAESINLPVSKPAHALAAMLSEHQSLRKLPGDHTSFAAKAHASKFREELLFALQLEDRVSCPNQRRQAHM